MSNFAEWGWCKTPIFGIFFRPRENFVKMNQPGSKLHFWTSLVQNSTFEPAWFTFEPAWFKTALFLITSDWMSTGVCFQDSNLFLIFSDLRVTKINGFWHINFIFLAINKWEQRTTTTTYSSLCCSRKHVPEEIIEKRAEVIPSDSRYHYSKEEFNLGNTQNSILVIPGT